MEKLCIFSILFVFIGSSVYALTTADYETGIFLYVYGPSRQKLLKATVDQIATSNLTKICDINAEWVVMTHGWTESCEHQWVQNLQSNYLQYRGGCVACIDYSQYANDTSYPGYLFLAAQFPNIVPVHCKILQAFYNLKFKPALGLIFGMSYGAQAMLYCGKLLTPKVAKAHICEPAAPGFDGNKNVSMGQPNANAAVDTQVIHTSADLGSTERTALVDWNFGYCGVAQPGAYTPPVGNVTIEPTPLGIPFVTLNHICCPTIYNWAFSLTYLALNKSCCNNGPNRNVNISQVPTGFRAGYFQPPGSEIPKVDGVGGTLNAWAAGNCSAQTQLPT